MDGSELRAPQGWVGKTGSTLWWERVGRKAPGDQSRLSWNSPLLTDMGISKGRGVRQWKSQKGRGDRVPMRTGVVGDNGVGKAVGNKYIGRDAEKLVGEIKKGTLRLRPNARRGSARGVLELLNHGLRRPSKISPEPRGLEGKKQAKVNSCSHKIGNKKRFHFARTSARCESTL